MTSDIDDLTYFLEYIHHQVQVDVLGGLQVWSERFTSFRNEGRYSDCQRLLRVVKKSNLPPYGLGIVRYGEAWLYDRLGYWQMAIKQYRASLDAFHVAGISNLDLEIWNNIGSIYQDQG